MTYLHQRRRLSAHTQLNTPALLALAITISATAAAGALTDEEVVRQVLARGGACQGATQWQPVQVPDTDTAIWVAGRTVNVHALVAALGQAGAGEADWAQLELDMDAHALDKWQQAFGIANPVPALAH